MFRAMFSPITRSNWTVFTAFGNAHQCCYGHQPAAKLVSITQSCKYIQLLLLMDENIVQNM
jgi:hypothetical protein